MTTNSNTETGENRGLKIFLIVAGLLLIVSPFVLDLYVMEVSKWLFALLCIGGILLFCNGFLVGIPEREARRYVDENGRFDMATPRSYTAKKVSGLQSFIGSGSPLKRNRIEQFDYADGNVHILMANGDEISAPLTEIEMLVLKNPKGQGPTGYEVHHGDEKINILHNTAAFEELEIEDMTNILARCSSVREPKSHKILAGVHKIISTVKGEVGSSDDSLIDGLITDKVEAMGKTKDVEIIGNGGADGSEHQENTSWSAPITKPRKKSKIQKILLWTLGVIAAAFLALIIIALMDSSDDNEVAGWDDDLPGYFVGIVEDHGMWAVRVEMKKDMVIKTDEVTIYQQDGNELAYPRFTVSEKGPKTFSFYSGPQEQLNLELDSDPETKKISLNGSYSISAVSGVAYEETSYQATFILMQPKSGENYYLGRMNGSGVFFDFTSDSAAGSMSGHIITPTFILNNLTGTMHYDESGDSFYEFTSEDDRSFKMSVAWWSNGGEEGFMGDGTINGRNFSVSAECITTY